MQIKNRTASITYKTLICIIGIVGVLMQVGVFKGEFNLKLFNYFTILSNILCIIYFILAIKYLLSVRDIRKLTYCSFFKGIVLMCITLTMLVANIMLGNTFTMNGTIDISMILLHLVVPIMTILDYILFDKKGCFRAIYPIVWLIVPYIYFIYIMISANYYNIGFNSKYPYPFLDIDKLGIQRFTIQIIIMSILYLLLGFILYMIDYKLGENKNNIKQK